MLSSKIFVLLVLLYCVSCLNAFHAPRPISPAAAAAVGGRSGVHRHWMGESDTAAGESDAAAAAGNDPMEDASLDAETRLAMEKAKRADELRAQEVFMKKSTGKHKCTNCDWVFDETKGDAMMIGGQIQPGTAFADLPSNWRCPVCRASKDSFQEEMIEIPGFEVNQGYGFGTNSMTSGQKSGLIFGGLGFFFLLFLSGYALN